MSHFPVKTCEFPRGSDSIGFGIVPFMLLMTATVSATVTVTMVIVIVIFFMLFIVLFLVVSDWSLFLNINPALSFDIVRSAGVDPDIYPGRCRYIAIDVYICTGKTWQSWRLWKAGRHRKTGIGFIES